MLPREEYIEQAYLFRTLLERMRDNIPMQELLSSIRHEILATTKLPLATDFLLAELKHTGGFGAAMDRLRHYFSPFQTFIVQQAEDDRGRFDMRVALAILAKEAEFRRDSDSRQGSFLYQFESLCRNRLSYDRGLAAMSDDPIYDANWNDWIINVRRQVGLVDLADLIFVRSEHYLDLKGRDATARPVLFGRQEGRIALANRHKDPLLLFAALQRQLGYPPVPRPVPADSTPSLIPQLARRIERLETRLKLLEEEQKGGIDLAKFYSAQIPRSED